jgi:hypothetical protein
VPKTEAGQLAAAPLVQSEMENLMATDQIAGLSPAEYLAFERQAERKHEYIDGEIGRGSGRDRGVGGV